MSENQQLNIVLIGDCKTGKSVFREMLINQKFNKEYNETNCVLTTQINISTNMFDITTVIWDIPGNGSGDEIFKKLCYRKLINVAIVFKYHPNNYTVSQHKIDILKSHNPKAFIIDIWNMSDLPEQQRFFQQNSQNYIEVNRPYLQHNNTNYQNIVNIFQTILCKIFHTNIYIKSILC